jgi:excisionase family DNA binding protein
MSIEIEQKKIICTKLILSISEAAELTGLDRDYIKQCLDQGELDYFLPPNRTRRRIYLSSLLEFIDNHSYNNNPEVTYAE